MFQKQLDQSFSRSILFIFISFFTNFSQILFPPVFIPKRKKYNLWFCNTGKFSIASKQDHSKCVCQK